jgi:hypothetical protein
MQNHNNINTIRCAIIRKKAIVIMNMTPIYGSITAMILCEDLVPPTITTTNSNTNHNRSKKSTYSL